MPRRNTKADRSSSELLSDLRAQIDRIDAQIVRLLNKRSVIVQKIGQVKERHDVPLRVLDRERAIYDRLVEINKGPFPDKALKNVFREIIEGSISLERRISNR